MSAKRRGFTLIEIMVAIAVSTLLFGACVAIYINVNKFKSRSEKLLFLHETARGINARLGRDLEGLHVADTDDDGDTELADYFELQKDWEIGKDWGDKLIFLAAVENPGKVDYCTVEYYVKSGKLYRVLSGGEPPTGGWSADEEDWVLAEGVEKLTVSTVPPPPLPAAGKLPATVTVTLKLADPGGRPAFRHFTVTLRPGSEEN